jgi:cytochrome c peroxidase
VAALLATGPGVRHAAAGEVETASGAERVIGLYADWEAHHRQAGGDRDVLVRLGWAKGISAVAAQAGGTLSLNLRTGSLEVELHGLPFDTDLWFVDNRPGPGASTMPGPGDRARLVARIPAGPATVREVVELGADAFADFEVDRVVVCRAGEGPRTGIALMGAPGAFQRLYTRSRRGTLPTPMDEWMTEQVELGKRLFEEEIFAGNGRTCATCHPATNNFTIDPRFIATLDDDDPLFVAERDPALAELENPKLMRQRGLILENLDGFDRPGVMRGVPHTLALPTSLVGPEVPFDNTLNPAFGIVPPAERTGWSGDGAPGSGSLREFAIGAVIQHFPRTLERVAGRDFRLPSDEELDALELFQLSLGRDADLDLARLEFTSPVVREGVAIFQRVDTQNGSQPAGKCSVCHSQAGANIDSEFFSGVLGVPVSGNANFGTGVNDLGALPADLIDPDGNPRDGGFARVAHDGVNCTPARGGFGTVTPEGGALPAGLCEEDFNTPSLVEAADTGPFFHNNAVDTIEGAVAFYNNDAFNDSAGGQILASLDSGGIGIRLDTSEVAAVAGFLRVVNALENIRESLALGEESKGSRRCDARELLLRSLAEQRDAIEVLEAVGLHPDAVSELRDAEGATERARRAWFRHSRRRHVDRAAERLRAARDRMVRPASG